MFKILPRKKRKKREREKECQFKETENFSKLQSMKWERYGYFTKKYFVPISFSTLSTFPFRYFYFFFSFFRMLYPLLPQPLTWNPHLYWIIASGNFYRFKSKIAILIHYRNLVQIFFFRKFLEYFDILEMHFQVDSTQKCEMFDQTISYVHFGYIILCTFIAL